MPRDRSLESRPAAGGVTTVELLIGAAILTAAAFRLRDEDSLVEMLRRLVEAVDAFTDEGTDEGEAEAEAEDAALALAAE